MFNKNKNPDTEPAPKKERKYTTKQLGKVVAAAAMVTALAHHEISQRADSQKQAEKVAELVATQQQLSDDLVETRTAMDKQRERAAAMSAGTSGVSKESLLGATLSSVEDLPGFGMEMPGASQERLRQATVKIAAREKYGENQDWWLNCTGVKVEVGGKTFISSAKHCFESGVNPGRKGGMDTTNTPAVDIINTSTLEYRIVDPNMSSPDATIANVTGIAYEPTGDDHALLSYEPVRDNPELTDINDIPAMTFGDGHLPVLGQEAAVYGIPSSSGNFPVSTTGIYLGRSSAGNESYEIDIIGISDVYSPYADACNYGASGSAAVFADGTLTGGLAMRNNISFTEGTNGSDDPVIGLQGRVFYEQELGLDLSRFQTLCGYSVIPESEAMATSTGIGKDYVAPIAELAPAITETK